MVTTNMLKQGVVALLCAGLIVSACAAEELSLSGAIEQVLKNNPSIAANRLSTDAAKQSAKGARKLANPDLEVSPSVAGKAGADSAIFFIQPLELNGSRQVRGEIAAQEAVAVSFEAAGAIRDVLLETRQAYWEVVRAQQSIKLNQANLEYVESLRAAVQKQLDIGTVPGAQLIKAEVELAQAKQDLTLAKLDLSQTKATLNSLMNRSKAVDFTVCEPLAFSETVIDQAKLLAVALNQRPEICAAKAKIGATRAQIRAVRLKQMPDLALQARTNTLKPSTEAGLAITISLPLLDWGSVKADKKRAEIAAKIQEKQLEATANSIALDVNQAINQVESSSQIIKEYQNDILDKSQQLAEIAQKGYEKGAAGYLEVLEAQRTLIGVKTDYYTALANHAKALAQLAWATGADLQNSAGTEVTK